jgi:neutral ceramidase
MSNLLAGTFHTNITPPIGCSVVGGFSDVRARGILDDLYANALVLTDGTLLTALVSIDLLAIPNHLYSRMVVEIEKTSGIPKENVFLAASHTHSGPALEDFIVEFGQISQAYIEYLCAQITTSILMAQQSMQPVKVSAARGENSTFLFNRRLRRADGRIVMNWLPDQFLQDVVGTAGPVDPDVFLVRFDTFDDKPLAMIVNYANHNNAAPGNLISADQAGYMRRILRQVYGEDLGVLFLLGACGNTNWVNTQDPNRFHPSMYQRMGKSLAGSILQLDAVRESMDIKNLVVKLKTLDISERPYVDYDTMADGCFGDGDDTFLNVYRKVRAQREGKPLEKISLTLSVLMIGEQIAIIGVPVELFAEFSLEIKQRSSVRYTVISELTNGSYGYIPTRQAFSEGGYEVRKLPGDSWLEVGTGEMITAASLELLNTTVADEGTLHESKRS